MPTDYQNEPFETIGAALSFLEQLPPAKRIGAVIEIAPGIYRERISISIPGVTLKGRPGKEKETIIRGELGAYEILEDGLKRGTFRTQTVLIIADGVTLENLTIENLAGPGHIAGQAIALHAYADLLRFRSIRLIGQQDTLFTGPLPDREVEPRGFLGPTESFPRKSCRMYFQKCYIEGNIDFIFGGAAAYFDHCEIFCRNSNAGRDPIAYITAPSTPAGEPFGYVMDHCQLTSDCPPSSCYLGRPWREDAKAVFLHCAFGAHIKEELWDDWGKKAAHERCFFATYHCSHVLKDTEITSERPKRFVPSYARTLTDEEALLYTKENVLIISDPDFWNF